MPEFCTCGAQLPPDSLFCNKCGKPQREIPEPGVDPYAEPDPVAEVVLVVEADPIPPQPLPLNFHNPVAVRVAGTVALVAMMLSLIPLVNIIAWIAGGFFAVILYRRRTGVSLNVRAGVQMGWITGVFMFAIGTVFYTAWMLQQARNGGIAGFFREQILQSQPNNALDPKVQEALRMLQTGEGVTAFVLVVLMFLVVAITLLSMAGGALGAKFAGRPAQPRA